MLLVRCRGRRENKFADAFQNWVKDEMVLEAFSFGVASIRDNYYFEVFHFKFDAANSIFLIWMGLSPKYLHFRKEGSG